MKSLLLATTLALSSCFTIAGAATGAAIGHFAGSTGVGALCGALFGLGLDINVADNFGKLLHAVILGGH